jgi:bacteriocin biosynthesis cyclodehydratase domain-containing protein
MGRIGLICTGDYGHEVGQIVAASSEVQAELLDATVVGAGEAGSPWSAQNLDAIVTVLWRPSDALCEGIDTHAFAAGIPWLPAFLEHPYLCVGPWILPPHGPCFRCVRARIMQHAGRGSYQGFAREAYDADPACGPLGHTPAHVRLTAGLIRKALAELISSEVRPGVDAWRDDPRLRMIRYLDGSGRFDAPSVIPCHGCPRCDQSAPRARRQRSLSDALTAAIGRVEAR